MNTGITYTSVKNNFIKGHLSVEDFIDEATWDQLSEGSKIAIFELSNNLIQYITTAIAEAVENDPNFIHEFKNLTLKVIKKENEENEEKERNLEDFNITYP